ncbi:hypothetical protein HZC20_01180 [Candidatus Peregrinibacteria bacterium]|nr:hypothetical protein [Candidatus Peregrinibacteria bacterium]
MKSTGEWGQFFPIKMSPFDYNETIALKCADCRHKIRFNMRNKRHLYDRLCAKCKTPIKTTFEKDRSEIIYCDKCYLEAME